MGMALKALLSFRLKDEKLKVKVCGQGGTREDLCGPLARIYYGRQHDNLSQDRPNRRLDILGTFHSRGAKAHLDLFLL